MSVAETRATSSEGIDTQVPKMAFLDLEMSLRSWRKRKGWLSESVSRKMVSVDFDSSAKKLAKVQLTGPVVHDVHSTRRSARDSHHRSHEITAARRESHAER